MEITSNKNDSHLQFENDYHLLFIKKQ